MRPARFLCGQCVFFGAAWPGWRGVVLRPADPAGPDFLSVPTGPDFLAGPDFPAGLTARLLRNFTSRFDDGAPLPTPHSPDRCRHLLILLTPPCWRSPTPLIAGQIAIIRTRAGSHFSGGATYGLHDYHPHAGRSQILTFHPFPIKPHEKIIGRGRFWVYLWDHM